MKRLILTEHQYSLLEALLDEVSVPMTSKIEKGGFIQVVYLIDKTENSQTLEVTEVHGGGKFVTGSNSSGNYIVNISGSLDPNDNTFTILKNGEYKAGGKTEGGKVTGEEIIGGSKIVVKNVTQVNISDVSKNVVDKVYTDLGAEIQTSDSENKEEDELNLRYRQERADEKDMREKRVRDMIEKNPQLAKAFRHQKTLFNGLINYGKAKGFGPAQALLKKYMGGYDLGDDADDDVDNVKSKFKVGKNVKFMITSNSVNITHGSQSFMLPIKWIGKARYTSQREIAGSIKMGGFTHKYQIQILKNVKDDIYKGKLNVEFKDIHSGLIDKTELIQFKVLSYDTN